jgi:hypothetical protein
MYFMIGESQQGALIWGLSLHTGGWRGSGEGREGDKNMCKILHITFTFLLLTKACKHEHPPSGVGVNGLQPFRKLANKSCIME